MEARDEQIALVNVVDRSFLFGMVGTSPVAESGRACQGLV